MPTPDRPGAPPDPLRARRVVLGATASFLMVLSVFFEWAVFGLTTGAHTEWIRTEGYGAREALIALVGLGAGWFVFNPMRPDPRVAQAAMLAAGIVSVTVGFILFASAQAVRPSSVVATAWPGPQAWMLLLAGILFVYLRFRRSLWPESVWMQEILSRKGRR